MMGANLNLNQKPNKNECVLYSSYNDDFSAVIQFSFEGL